MEIQKKMKDLRHQLTEVSHNQRLTIFLGSQGDSVKKEIEMQDKKAMEIVNTHYSSSPFNLKPSEYWEKAPKPDIFRAHLFKWCSLCGVRKDELPDEVAIEIIRESLVKSYPYMNENSVTDALHKNLAGEFGERIVMFYNKFDAKYLYDVLFAYDTHLRNAHSLAVGVKKKYEKTEPVEPTPEELEQKNISAMKSVFAEFKATGNENLISGLYFDFFHNRGLITLTNDQKRDYLKKAQIKLKEIKTTGEGMISADKIIKSIDAGGYEEEVRAIGRKLAIIDFFNTTSDLPF